MKTYLQTKSDQIPDDFISCMDELPLWSAPFGLCLLQKVKMKKAINVLDVGCGMGFPLIELAQRLGNTCRLIGIDPWDKALNRVRLKIKHLNLTNVSVIKGKAEKMPFDDGYFNLIVSNNGLNNVENLKTAMHECSRVAAHGAQMVLTQNLEGTMIEFYHIFDKILQERELFAESHALKDHIYQKRPPVHEIFELLEENNFQVSEVLEQSFQLRFTDAEAFFSHSLINFWFLPAWAKIVKPERYDEIFDMLEKELNNIVVDKGELSLKVPFVLINSNKI
jgi:ubiquinone/menaquinone biosynthesis C-methylase UbiE